MIPIILGAIALGTTAFGGLACVAGMADMDLAKKIGERAQKRYKSKVSQLQADWETANQIAEEYSQLQIDIKMCTVGRFVDFIERRIGQQASQSDRQILEGLEISIQQLKQYQVMAIEAEEWVKGGLSAAVTGAAVSSGTITLAKSVGTATVTRFFGLWTTEVGISSLGGAAARNATIAWLGGSSMAVGGFVLGGLTLGPALMIGGFQLAGKAEEALTKARKYEAEVNTAIAQFDAARDFLQQARRQIFELEDLVKLLNDRAVLGLNELESLPSFNKDRDACKFQQLGLLIKALTEIIKTPVLDKKGLLNQDAVTVHAKYRYLGV
ncbi:hypothetical protein H6G17_11695 [Chroococcidiopsis sp. FACHB-1243]|uniref:hypothetical protein n=1 Tax=Chroococcidiopsis sp. [FACHB-1243] TaxID=2692781 RepID=UPI0017825D8B|nr:hypothetical protein [Chroococcidiopsis sp. [FACHB-1243]]MBD2306176.1 hypothetical protein [Chroococcidiopsis sp. [FACHB-1243]]